MKRLLKAALLVALAVLTLLAGAPAFRASASYYTSSQDRQYVSLLIANGIPASVASSSSTISLGHTIADTLAASPSESTVTTIVVIGLNEMGKAGLSTDVSAHVVAVIVGSAVYVYQPGLVPLLLQWARDHSGGTPAPETESYLAV